MPRHAGACPRVAKSRAGASALPGRGAELLLRQGADDLTVRAGGVAAYWLNGDGGVWRAIRWAKTMSSASPGEAASTSAAGNEEAPRSSKGTGRRWFVIATCPR